jgi:hypothetical protein
VEHRGTPALDFDFDKQLLDNIVYASHITYKKMTIAKNWIEAVKHSVAVEGRRFSISQRPLSSQSGLPEQSGVFLPSRRDREVPYGMKGGEHNGRSEEIV